MTNIGQLMQDSEVMRMLKLGNPERAKDFYLDRPAVGLFDIERLLKDPLEAAIYSSPDPDGTIAKFDTALMLNNMGLDMETAHRMAEMGFSSSVTGIDTKDKNYWEALNTTAQHSHWQDMKGITTSLYRISGNRDFLSLADGYDAKIRKNPMLNTYGKVGDLVLDSVQPTLSAMKFIATTAMLSWIPGGIANKVWGNAVAKTVAKGGGIAANAVNWFATGYSQAGDVLYNVMQMEDAEGNRLPWDSPVGGILFHSLAGLMGLVELGSMEMFPWYKHLKSRLTNRELAKHIERGLLSAAKSILWKGTAGTFTEGGEDGLQTGLGIGFENALKALANKDGAEFEITSLGDTVKEAAKATVEAGKSMFLTSFLTAGFGQSAYSLRLRASAKKNFLSTKDSMPIDSIFVGVPKAVVEQEEEGVATGPVDPVRVVNVGTHLAPIDSNELKKAARAKRNGAEAMEVIVEDISPMDASDRIALLHRAALATEGRILEDSALGYGSQDALDRAAFLLSSNTEAMERREDGIDLTIRDEDGRISPIPLRLIREGQEAVDPDISYVDDPEAPYSLSRLTADRALAWQERQLIKQSIGDVVAHTGGRISHADLEANVDAIKLVAETLDIPTDKMLRDNLVFRLEKTSPKGERGYIENITLEGRKQYTIHVSERADATTILHELGHFMRGTASKEQLAQFSEYYGKGSKAIWLEDINKVGDKYHVGNKVFDTFDEAKALVVANEEAFADDFVAYLRTGEAPTEGLRNIFQRMKAVLTKFVKEFGYTLDPQLKQAFDNLLAPGVQGVREVSGTYGPIPTGPDGNVLFQIAPQRDFYAYQDAHMERTHKRLFYIEGMNPEFAERIENAGDIGRELAKLDGGSGWLDHFYVGEKMRKLGRVIDDDGTQFYLKDFMELPSTDGQKDQERQIVQEYKDQYNAYPGELGSLGELSKRLSFAVLDRDINAMKDAWIDFLLEWNELRESHGIGKFPLHLYGESLRHAVTDAEDRRLDQLYEETGLPKLYQDSSEYDAVVHRFKDTALWLKAPNGKRTNLTERQWVQVRTPSFKKWFGDWEASENLKWLMSAEPIVALTGDEFKEHIVDSVVEYFRQTGNRVTRKGLGEVTLTRHDIQTSIAHGLGRNKAAAFAAVPDVIVSGREFYRAKDYKGRGYDSITIAAPISIGGEEFICEVVINQRQDSNNFYLHEVEVKEKLQFGNQVRNYMDDNHPNRNTRTGASRLIITRLFADGKFESSKTVDENGEPLILHHGTPSKEQIGIFHESEYGYWFTDSRKLADQFTHRRGLWTSRDSGYIENVFLKMKNPLIIDAAGTPWDNIANTPLQGFMEWKPKAFGNLPKNAVNTENVFDYAKSNGFDGVIFKDIKDSANSYIYGNIKASNYVVMDTNQIKSINNHGTWDSNHPSILFQPAPPTDNEAFKVWFRDSKVVDEYGSPKIVYHGSPVSGISEFNRFGANGGERGLIYATESEAKADDFSYEQLPGSSSFTFRPGEKGEIYPLYMSIKTPLDFRSISMQDFDNIKSAIGKYGAEKELQLQALEEIIVRGSVGHQYFKFVATDLVRHLPEYGYDGLIAEMSKGGPLEYAVVSPVQVKSINNIGSWDPANPNILFQQGFEKLPESSPWRLFQLAKVESVVTVRDNAPKTIRVYEVSMQPEEMHRLFGEDKPASLTLEDFNLARDLNANPTRVSDWQQIYARAMESKGKDGKDLKFSDMRKVNKDGKLMNVPVIALSKGCQRAQVTVERVTNGVLPNETNVEACYGGTCWVNRQFNSKFGAFENMEVRDLLMPSPENVDNWFKKSSIKEFLTTGPFIREGQMGCSSHAFPILEGYGVSLAETWLKNIKAQGIKQKTIFITAAYAPVTWESYERLLPYKDLFEIHVSISGWFHKNELMTRLAEFKTIRDIGLPVSFRIVTNKDNVADLIMPNQEWLDVQLARLGIHQDEVLETPYHDDAIKKGQKRSEPTGDYKFICCETGKCMTCGAKCMSKITHQTSEMASYERLDTHEKSPAVSTGLVPLDTSAIPQIQPSGNSYLIPEDAKNQLVLERAEQSQEESPTKLYQLSDEARNELLESRKRDVRNAVENFYWIPEDILMEYAGEDWADNEIQFREHLRNFPWALEEARKFMNSVNEDGQYPTTEEFVDYIKDKQSMDPEVGDFDWILEDEMWYRRVYEYAKIKSPEELDRQFIRLYTRSNEKLLLLARRLKGYQDLNQVGKSDRRRKAKSQMITYRWGAFKGVSTLVKGLNRESTDTEFERARNIVKDNPRPYRRALMVMEQAEARVLQFRGIADVDLSRDAYYESLGESMQDALNEPLLLNEMTDRQAAEYLRTTDDKRERFEAREKLATHSGVLAMEQEANAELARLADEHEKTVRYLEREIEKGQREIEETIGKLQGKLKEKSEKASMVPDLKRTLADRRARVAELNSRLSETKKLNKQLLAESKAMKEREKARKLKEKIEDLTEQVKRSTRFTVETMDASFERLFTWVKQRVGLAYVSNEEYVPAPWEQTLDLLAQYLPDNVRANLNLKVPLDKWSVKTMEDLIVGMRMLARDARVQQNQRMLDQGTRRDALQVAYYRQVIGKDPEITGNNSISYDLADALSGEPGKAGDSGFSGEIKTANAWFMKIQRLARKLDGNREGVLYELLVRGSHYNQQQEFRYADARVAKEYEKRKDLGISDESLQQDLYTYTPVVSDLAGKSDSITLTRDQVIGVYIYAKHEVSRDKLLDKVVGNRMTEIQITEAIAKLSDKEREYAEWLIQELGGDESWLRLAETYYRVYNRRLGRRPDYFTFEAENKSTEGNTDLLVGPKGDPVRYVDKGMTKQVNVWARYALRLDATNIFEKNVRRQEHFIAWAQWVRDLNFMLSGKGALGRIIADRYGEPYRKSIQTFVNEVGSPNIIMSDMDHILNKLVSTASGATLAFSTLSFFRQIGSATAIFRGDVTMYGFMKATSQLMNPSQHEEIIKFIDQMAPDIKHRSFDLDKTRLAGTKFQTRAGRTSQRVLVFGMQHMGWMDKSVAYALWLSAYETYLKKHEAEYIGKYEEEGPERLSREAAFRASQFIAETQSTTNPTDLNEIQRSRNPWMRLFFMFSNDLMQHWNQIWKDIPYYWAQKDHRKLIGTMVALSLNLGLQLAISGALLPDDDGDEEKERRKILLALLSEISRDSIPLIGSAVSGGIEGWTGSGIVTPAPIGSLINAMTTGEDEKILARLWNLILEGAKVSGVPVVQGRKVVKSVAEKNPFYVLNTDWGRFGERWFGE